MVVCVHTPLPEVVELMRPTSAEVSIGNKGVSQTSTNSTPERQSDSADVKAPDLQVPPDAPWLINWCAHAANKRDTSLVLRLEALQFLGSFVKSYVFLARYATIEKKKTMHVLHYVMQTQSENAIRPQLLTLASVASAPCVKSV